MMAVWDDDFGKASGRDEGTGLAHFLLNPVNDTVDTACSAVDNAAAHAVDGIGADHLFRRIKADLRQLRGAGRQRIQGDAKPGIIMPPRKFLLRSIAEIVVAVPMSMMMSGVG